MGYEVDFLPVGDGERGGDAIAVRFGNLHGRRNEQFVMVIDGGTKASGEELVKHVRKYYDTERVDLVVSTHPDADHASGLTVVLDELDVGRLWMHKPWEHASEIHDLFRDGRITDASLKDTLKRALENANELERIANRKGIPIDEPFSDNSLPFQDYGIHVLGPSEAFYESLLPYFRETPTPRHAGLFERAVAAASEAAKWVLESWPIETLTNPEDDATSAENNTSVLLLLNRDDRLLLFTGDAGVPALTLGADHADYLGFDLPSLRFVQMPHHGSRRNVGPTVLNRILGSKYQEPTDAKSAFVSAPKEGDPKHPSRKVSNAFQRRGAKNRVFGTKGRKKWHYHEAPDRDDYDSADSLPFFDQVEE